MCVSYSANVKEDHEKWGEKSTKEGIHQTRYQKEYMLNMMESMRWGPKKDKKRVLQERLSLADKISKSVTLTAVQMNYMHLTHIAKCSEGVAW